MTFNTFYLPGIVYRGTLLYLVKSVYHIINLTHFSFFFFNPDFRDYMRVSLQSYDFLVQPVAESFCLLSEFLNIRGDECTNCTILAANGSTFSLHVDSYYGPRILGCYFGGGIENEDNFGNYVATNPDFRCTSSMSSTSQFWLGRFEWRLTVRTKYSALH